MGATEDQQAQAEAMRQLYERQRQQERAAREEMERVNQQRENK